jgi:hypothetical protein
MRISGPGLVMACRNSLADGLVSDQDSKGRGTKAGRDLVHSLDGADT